jgi:hypothetical protein
VFAYLAASVFEVLPWITGNGKSLFVALQLFNSGNKSGFKRIGINVIGGANDLLPAMITCGISRVTSQSIPPVLAPVWEQSDTDILFKIFNFYNFDCL